MDINWLMKNYFKQSCFAKIDFNSANYTNFNDKSWQFTKPWLQIAINFLPVKHSQCSNVQGGQKVLTPMFRRIAWGLADFRHTLDKQSATVNHSRIQMTEKENVFILDYTLQTLPLYLYHLAVPRIAKIWMSFTELQALCGYSASVKSYTTHDQNFPTTDHA